MNGDQAHFREIPLSEYRRRHEDVDNRVTMAELETGLVVEAFSTNRLLMRQDKAVNFTVQIELGAQIKEPSMGRLAITLLVFSGDKLKPIPGVDRTAWAYPEVRIGPVEPVAWTIADSFNLYIPQFRSLRYGFLGKWSDDNLSDLDNFKATIPDEQTDTSPLSQQRSHPLLPVDREEGV